MPKKTKAELEREIEVLKASLKDATEAEVLKIELENTKEELENARMANSVHEGNIAHLRDELRGKSEGLTENQREIVFGLLNSIIEDEVVAQSDIKLRCKFARSILKGQTLEDSVGNIFLLRPLYATRYLGLSDEKKKVTVVKTIRDLTGLGLKEAKAFSESPVKVLVKNVDQETAMRFNKKMEEAGAKVEVVKS